jgi:palmitoyl transferase
MPGASTRAAARLVLGAALLAIAWSSRPAHALGCDALGRTVEAGCRRLADTWRDGGNEMLVSGYAYHVPATWTPERRAELNANAWGAGVGRTVEDADGDTHTVFFLAFLDSHKNVESQVGYAWHRFWGPREGVQAGLGYTAMVVQRPDIWNGVPFPVLLPLAALRYGKGTVEATFIPTLSGSINHGSTIYVFGRIGLD